MRVSPDGARRVFRSAPQLLLVTGGARSGKSRFACSLARRFGRHIVYLATCRSAEDAEMVRRIARHRRERPTSWKTLEAPADPAQAIKRLRGTTSGVLLDCLTLYVSELLLSGASDQAILRTIRRLARALRAVTFPVIVVTNEVGGGVVPEHALGRRFRDLAGAANQIIAQAADQVVLMIAGIPVRIKGGRT